MAQPTGDPEWNSGAANRVEPTGPKKILGWTVNEIPPGSYFNWWMWKVYQWCLYLKNLAGETFTWTALHTFGAGLTSIGAANFNAVYAAGAVTAAGLTVNGAAEVNGDTHVDGTLGVDGAAATGALTVNGAAEVNGAAHVDGTLGVDGAATVGATLGVTGAATVGSIVTPVPLSGGTPVSTTAHSNKLTNKNVCKAWALIKCNSGTITVEDGFNILSVTDSGNDLLVTFPVASPMANALYAVVMSMGGGSFLHLSDQSKGTTSFIIGARQPAGTTIDLSAQTGLFINVIVYGAQ